MEKMFIHIQKGTTFTSELKKKYANSIVFDDNNGTIWTHEKEYGSVEEALAALKYFSSVSGNSGTAAPTASKEGSVLSIKGKADDYVTTVVDSNGVTIQATTKLTTELAEAKAAGTGASKALEDYKEENDAAVDAAQKQADKGVSDAAAALAEAQKKVASVKSGSNGIAINGTATDPTVALKLDNTGNVKLEETTDGLKASVEIEKVSVPVTGVKSGDKVLALSGTELTSTLKLKYDGTGKKLQLLGIGDAVVHEIDATAFVKDGMISDIEYDQDTHTLSITFNTDAGDVTIDDIDLSDLVDVYEEGNGIVFTDGTAGKKVNVQVDTTSENFLTVSASGVKLVGVQDAIDAAKTAVGNYTVNSKKISTNPTLGAADIKLTSYAKGSDGLPLATSDTVNKAFGKVEVAIEAVKATADSAVQNVSVTNGTYVTATVTGTTTKTIAINDSAIESLFAWEEL